MTKQELDHVYYLEHKAHLADLRAKRYQANRDKILQQNREWKKKYRPASGIQRTAKASATKSSRPPRTLVSQAESRVRLKILVLSHYGLAGRLQCSWPDCSVIDVDMLSLDHVNNDGAAERKNGNRGGGGVATYQRVKTAGFPEGYQTLCHNHQWKKELMRRRETRK